MTKDLAPKASTIAIVGAGGFAASRLATLAGRSPEFKPIPILRSYAGLALLGPLGAEVRVVDTGNAEKLAEGLEGAHVAVNMTTGDASTIPRDTKTIYEACRRAGVQRLIHISSAVVYDRVSVPNLPDDAPPARRLDTSYARGKAQAENWLRETMSREGPKVDVLRPGVIWGPGSRWSQMVGDQLLRGGAVLSNGGKGKANLVYVDNLARIILAVARRTEGPSGFYNVSDREEVTWATYYQELARRLGYPAHSVMLWPDSKFRLGPKNLMDWVGQRPKLALVARELVSKAGPKFTHYLKSKISSRPGPPDPERTPGPPILLRSVWIGHNMEYQPPSTKVHRDFGPIDLIPFPEAADATSKWLEFAGFAAPAAEVAA